MYWPNLNSVALPSKTAIEVLGIENPNLGEEEAIRAGMVPFKRALMTSYRPSIVTFPLSLGVSEILPLLSCSTPLIPPRL